VSISVIVSNLNGQHFLPRLLQSLQAQKDVKLEIVVVDRHSHDDSLDILSAYPQVRVLSEPPESGLVSGYAAGAMVARHEHLFFCNEDMWFDERCLSALEERLSIAKRVGAADAWQWTYDGRHLIHGGVRFRPFRWDVFSPLPWRMQHNMEELPSGAVIPFGCAGAVLIHRQMYDELGGWDREFFLDYEDMDFFLRGWQRGWHCVTVPEAKVYHAVSASNVHYLANVKQTVSHRRYISARSNECMIGIKTFSGSMLHLPFLVWLSVFVFNLKHAQFRRARWDLSAFAQIVRRVPSALRFRRQNRRWGRTRPGEQFFTADAFNAAV
jgi:GT2 family glycosyltransferase